VFHDRPCPERPQPKIDARRACRPEDRIKCADTLESSPIQQAALDGQAPARACAFGGSVDNAPVMQDLLHVGEDSCGIRGEAPVHQFGAAAEQPLEGSRIRDC
jgi:hypothetical protein